MLFFEWHAWWHVVMIPSSGLEIAEREAEGAKGSTILGAIMTGRVEEPERERRERKGFKCRLLFLPSRMW